MHLHGISSVIVAGMAAADRHLDRHVLLPLAVPHRGSGSPSQSAGNHARVCVAAPCFHARAKNLCPSSMANESSLSGTHQAARARRHEVLLRRAVDAPLAAG
jgi:hypothetical protein